MKYLKAILLTLFTSLFLFNFTVQAQDDVNPVGLSGRGPAFACLDIEWCRDNDNCSSPHVHKARLTTSSQTGTPNSEGYVAECFDNVPGYGTLCTTGNSELDKELFCTEQQRLDGDANCDRYTILQDTIDYSITHDHEGNEDDSYGWYWEENGQMVKKDPPQKVRTNGLGKIIPAILEVKSSTPEKLVRRFVLFTTGVTPGGSNTGLGGQQQDILTFEKRSSSCVGETWDPEGRVFDAVSLEPIPNAEVVVKELMPDTNYRDAANYSQELASRNNLTIINPYKTHSTGYFNFLLTPQKYYRLDVNNVSGIGYQLMAKADASKIPANAAKIYFDAGTNRQEYWYSDSDAFYQGTTLLRKDIPLMPVGGTKGDFKIEELTRNVSQAPTGNTIIVEGKVTHPFATLTIETCSKESGAEVCNNPVIYTTQNGGPDEWGVYRVQLDQSRLQAGEYYKPTFQKANLVTATITKNNIVEQLLVWAKNLLIGEVQAQESNNKVSGDAIYPIISYIEGFAYDTEGNLLPGATVGLYVEMMEQPVYYTTANENGYYKITSENIPNGDYVIKYSSADGQTKATITTAQFAKQNEAFIASEEINPYSQVTRTTDPRRNLTPSYVPPQKISAVTNEFPEASPSVVEPTQVAAQQTSNNVFLIGAILLLLVATAGTLIGVYLYKKKMQEPQI